MSNYDEYLAQEQYKRDEEADDLEKVWMVLNYQKEVIFSSDDEEEVRSYYSNLFKRKGTEFGWIYTRDTCSDFYRNFNVIESYEFKSTN